MLYLVMRSIKSLVIGLLMVLVVFRPVMALGPRVEELFSAGDNVVKTGVIEGSIFNAGRNLKIDAVVQGITFAAGENLLLEGESEYLFAAGRMLNVTQQTDNDLFAAGQSLNFDQGEVGRDAYLAGENINFNGKVGRNLFIGAKNASVSGVVKGDVILGAEKVTITEGTVIEGTLKYNDDARLNMADGVEIIGGTNTYQVSELEKREVTEKQKVINRTGWYLFKVTIAWVFGLMLWWLFPQIFKNLEKQNLPFTMASFWKKIGTGLLVLLLIPLLALLILVTIIGIPISLLMIVVYGFAMFTAQIFVGYLLGAVLRQNKNKKWLDLVVGVMFLVFLKMLPMVGELISFLSLLWGLGIQYRLLLPKKA